MFSVGNQQLDFCRHPFEALFLFCIANKASCPFQWFPEESTVNLKSTASPAEGKLIAQRSKVNSLQV